MRARLGGALVVSALTVIGVNAFAILAFLFFLRGGPGAFSYGGAALVVALAVARSNNFRTAVYATARAVVVCGLAIGYATQIGRTDAFLILGVLLLLGQTMQEPTVRKLATPAVDAVHLPGFASSTMAPRARLLFPADVALTVFFGVAARFGWPPAIFFVLTLLTFLATAVAVLAAVRTRRVGSGGPVERMRACLEALNPSYLVYFSGPAGATYQINMWLPYFDRIGEPYAIVVRERPALAVLADATSAPVLVCPSLSALETMIVPSLNAVFYVNNGMKNTHCVRFAHLTHVQLLHGDSDKPPSFSPVTAMYDKVFVAGQAGIDRYAANGVFIPRQKFEIVGRPQVEVIAPARGPVAAAQPPTVLYAPTWKGHYEDTNFCSLPMAETIVTRLIARGATVIFRVHPYSLNDPESAAQIAAAEQILAAAAAESGRAHKWGTVANDEMSLFECFDASDALVADVSSVVSDYLFSSKPFAVVDMVDDADRFPVTFPLARAAYVLRRDASNLDEALVGMLGADPLEPARLGMRDYYLGPFPADGYADAFLATARRVATQAHAPMQAHATGADAGDGAEGDGDGGDGDGSLEVTESGD